MENKKIGDKGSTLNLSVASRAANITPDKNYFKKHDEYLKKNKDEFIKYLFFGLIMLILSIGLYYRNHYIWGTFFLLFALIALFITYNVNIKLKGEVYSHGLLIPAVVTQINPTKILALANVTDGLSDEIVWGFRYLTVENLPNHHVQVGEKIPCVALFSLAIKGLRRYMEPHPLCWGTPSKAQLQEAIDTIDQDEWKILLENQSKIVLNQDEPEDEIVFMNENLQVINPDTRQPLEATNPHKNIIEVSQSQAQDISEKAQQFVAKYPNKKLDYSLQSIAVAEEILDAYIASGNLQEANVQYLNQYVGNYFLQTYKKNYTGKLAISNEVDFPPYIPQVYFVSNGETYFICIYPTHQIFLKLDGEYPIDIYNVSQLYAKAVANAKPGEVDLYV